MYYIKSPIKPHIDRLACLQRVKEQEHHKQVDKESCLPLVEDHCLFNMGIAIGHQKQFPRCLNSYSFYSPYLLGLEGGMSRERGKGGKRCCEVSSSYGVILL